MSTFNPDKNLCYKFFDSCPPVVGKKRGVVYDLQRDALHFFDKRFLNIMKRCEGAPLNIIYNYFRNQENILDDYLQYLLENEIIFLTANPELFPGLNTELKKPFLLDILFIEIDHISNEKKLVLQKLDEIGCIELIFITKIALLEPEKIQEIREYIEQSKIQRVTFISKYRKNNYNFSEWFIKERRIVKMIFYNATTYRENNGVIITRDSLYELLNRRVSGMESFTLNTLAYTESLNHNLFYNRKAYIDNSDNIKHYITEKKNYGNLSNVDFCSLLTNKDFTQLWNISKDKIEVCEDCEFRYICPDNRIPARRKNGNFYHKTKCNYNPRTTLWDTEK